MKGAVMGTIAFGAANVVSLAWQPEPRLPPPEGSWPESHSCTEERTGACWVEVANRPGCSFWLDQPIPGFGTDWSGEWSGQCSGGRAVGSGTVTWRFCIWDNGACMPSATQRSGTFVDGIRHGPWHDGPGDAADCRRWNTNLFFKAASLDEVVACLKDGADPNDNKPGYLAGTPLHHGVRRNSLAMVRTLLDAGADVHRRDSGGSTPLHTAASSSDSPAMLDALLLGGADVGAPDKDWNTPLHELARFNSLDQHSVALAGVLLDAGADVNARQYHGYTPLHFAARKKSLAIVEMLLDAGAEVDARALLEAVPNFKEEHTSVLEALLAAGADPTAKDHGGRTALHYAAVSGNVTSCEVLIEAGADVTGRDNDGETPLHFAATLDEVEGIDCLLKAGADIEARDDQKNTPLHSSLDSDVHLVPAALPRGLYPVSVDLPAVDVLIHAGANLDARNAAGDTPLHLAAKYIAGSGGVPHGYDERTGSFASREVTGVRRYHAGDAIFALLEAGAEPTAKNRRGRTPCYFYRRNVFLRGQEIDLCE